MSNFFDEPEKVVRLSPHQPPGDTGHLINLTYFRDIEPTLDAGDFVQGILVAGSSVVVYGESNSGKTFFVTDLALHVAAGREWNGRRVDQGAVVYCALEGSIGFRNRVAAWKAEHGLEDYDLPFAAIQQGLNLADPQADVEALIEAIERVREQTAQPVKMVVVDTLSRALAGRNENAPDDMGALVMCMDIIRQRTGCVVVFIHHAGKDASKGARGHSLLRAAIDTEIEIVDDGIQRTATIVKQRELGGKGNVLAFSLRIVELGQNRHGEPVTTCIVEPGDPDAKPRPKLRVKGDAARALEILTNLCIASGRPDDPGVPAGALSVPEDWWRDRFYDEAKPGAEIKAKQKAFRRSADTLIEANAIGMSRGRVWVA